MLLPRMVGSSLLQVHVGSMPYVLGKDDLKIFVLRSCRYLLLTAIPILPDAKSGNSFYFIFKNYRL